MINQVSITKTHKSKLPIGECNKDEQRAKNQFSERSKTKKQNTNRSKKGINRSSVKILSSFSD